MNVNAKASLVCVTGMMGTGKTQVLIDLWNKSKAKYKFAFDPQREIAKRLGLRNVTTLEQIKAEVNAGRPVLFDPSQMFDDLTEALTFFARLVFNLCEVLPGVKFIGIDEVQRCVNRRCNVPKPLNDLCDLCRRAEIHLCIVCNKGIHKLHDDILSQMTELYVFKQISPRAYKILKDEGIDAERVKEFRLPDRAKGIAPQFIHQCI